MAGLLCVAELNIRVKRYISRSRVAVADAFARWQCSVYKYGLNEHQLNGALSYIYRDGS
jgi:hypothetical protein